RLHTSGGMAMTSRTTSRLDDWKSGLKNLISGERGFASQRVRHMSVRGKLIMLIAASIGFMLLIGLLGIQAISGMKRDADELYKDKLQTINLANEARALNRASEVYAFQLLTATVEETQAGIRKSIESYESQYEQAIETLKATEIGQADPERF